MSHKYLNDIGVKDESLPWNWQEDDKRQAQWKKERTEYGFDQRDTWSLDYTLSLLVYERLKMYKEIASKVIDLNHPMQVHEFEGKNVLLGDAIDRVILGFEAFITAREENWHPYEKITEEYYKCWSLLAIIMPRLWW